jgi:hypothetical protein
VWLKVRKELDVDVGWKSSGRRRLCMKAKTTWLQSVRDIPYSDLFVNYCNALVTKLMTIIMIIKVTFEFCVVGKLWPVTCTNAWKAFRYCGKGGSCCGLDPRKSRDRSYLMIKYYEFGKLEVHGVRIPWSRFSNIGKFANYCFGGMWECFWTVYLEDLPNKLWPIQLHSHQAQCFSVFTPVVTRGNQHSWKYTNFKM